MSEKNTKKQAYRHAPAFMLLFLAMEDQYGASLLNKLLNELPYFHTDSAVVYRSLQELEENGSVVSYWETNVSGPAKKWYKITDVGRLQLAEYKTDIEKRKKNFEYFLAAYENMFGKTN